MSVSVAAVAIGSLFVGAGIGFMLGARQARSDAQADAPKTAKPDASSDADVAVSADEPRLNPREELKMTFVCHSFSSIKTLRMCAFSLALFATTTGQVVRQDLHMGKGKTAAQCCHACLGAYKRALKMRPAHVRAWSHQGQAKVVLRVDTVEEMFVFFSFLHFSFSFAQHHTCTRVNREALAEKAEQLHIPNYIVVDAGRTQIAEGSETVLALGPGNISEINQVTGSLKLLS